ncbi:hypothetical protein FAZ15_08410 [Sphingobacterium olei]|uniref:Uncharacterized protein n=1 Tax=Sphingobacterium olei TaxID=2571155 RepID=A0A4U0PER2_9SPHI|nr:hypothetical protein [Sphingobacterium olei]TJZ61214.1 hypothetical protein FAZ15_08410 [Sphingobacterium olei]
MRILLISIFTLLSPFTFAQNQDSTRQKDIQLIKKFIADLGNENIAVDVILSQYIKVDHPSNETYDYLEVSLEEVRINVLYKHIADITYIPYANMPRKEIRDIDPEELDINRMYFLQYKKRQVLAVYIEKDKIASFTLVSKGNNLAHFVTY